MSLSDIIMAEHSKAQAEMIADIIVQKPDLLEELLEIIFAEKEPLSRRAAWPLRFIHENDEQLLASKLPMIVKQLPKVKSVAVQRNLLYILAYSDIPEPCQGELLQYSSQVLLDRGSPVASLIYSLDIFYNIAKSEPDLLNELKLIIELLLPNATPGVRSKSVKTLKKIERL